MIPAMGLSMAVATLAGQNIGAGNLARASEIGRLGALIGFAALTAIGAIVFAFAPALVAFFVPEDAGVIAAGAGFLRTISWAWGFLGLQLALTGVLRASGAMVIAMVLTLVSQWVLQFPLAYVLSKHTPLGISGLWWSLPISQTVIALITMGVYARGDWKKKKLVDDEDRLSEKVSEEILSEEAFTGRGAT
jgi:Na+-driven multidrug efflux pump